MSRNALMNRRRDRLSVRDRWTHTVRSLITVLMLLRSSPKRRTARRSISISVSVHLALKTNTCWAQCKDDVITTVITITTILLSPTNENVTTQHYTSLTLKHPVPLQDLSCKNRHWSFTACACCVSHPAGLESDTGCSCMVSSPSLVNAAPAAEKISPTCREEEQQHVSLAIKG